MITILEYFEYIVLAFLFLLLVLISVLITYNRFFSKYFSNRKFRVKSLSQVNPETNEKKFTLSIYNNNINDIRVTGFGFLYQKQNIDYYQTYLVINKLSKDTKLMISSRDLITLPVEVEALKVILKDMNKGKFHLKRLRVFVTDSLGLSTITSSPFVRRQVQYLLKQDLAEKNKEIRSIHKKAKEELREANAKKWSDFKLRFKEEKDKLMLKIRAAFSKKHK